MENLTNLVVNNTQENILKSFGYSNDEIEKARHGVYADTAENRKLKRVGQEYGSKKKEETPTDKKLKKDDKPTGQRGNKEQEARNKDGKSTAKEELFSKNGMLDDKGNMNSKSEHVKRMYELEKKVDNGSATPEEKKEYATLRNQSKNEKDRYVHEGRKKLGVEEDEPKYKTVDERRSELLKQKDANAKPKDELTHKKEAAMKDSKVSNFIGCFDGMAEMAMDSNEDVMELLDMGYTPNSPRVQREIRRNMLERNDFGDDIMYAVRKYGIDAVESLLVEKNSNTECDFMSEGFARELITNATLKEREKKESKEEKIETADKTKDVDWDKVDPQEGMKKIFDSVENFAAENMDATLTDVQEDKIGNTMRKLIERGLTKEQFNKISDRYESILGAIQDYDDYKYYIPYATESYEMVGNIFS